MRSNLNIIVILLLSIFLSFFITIQPSWGEIPKTISYQGVLTDQAGEPAAGNFQITFKLYDSATLGTALWSETQSIAVNAGIFNAILGSQNALNLAFSKPCWLGITIAPGQELTPRVELTSVPYSLNAQSIADSIVTGDKVAKNQIVRSINSMTDDVKLAAGVNVTITQSNDTLYIASIGGNGSESVWIRDAAKGEVELVNSGDKVGIGTTEPADQLHVAGNITGSDTLKIESRNYSDRKFEITSTTAQKLFATNNLLVNYGTKFSPASLTFVETGNPRMRIDAGGNVGIGLLVPQEKLEVNGVIRSASGGFKFPDGTVQTTAASGDNHSLDAADGDPVDAVVVDNAGKVGIGTTEPADQLHVASNITCSDTLKVESKNYSGRKFEMTSTTAQRLFATNDLFVNYGTKFSPASLTFLETGNNRMRIDAGGNVGIGLPVPQEKLDVNGVIRSATGGFKFPDGTVQTTAASGNNHSLDAADGDPVDAVIVDNDGNVGIGTTEPKSKLHLNGKLACVDTISVESKDFTGRKFEIKSSIAQYLVTTNDLYIRYGAPFTPASVIFQESGGNEQSMRIQAGGYVGIGDYFNQPPPRNILTIHQNSSTDPIADAWTTYSSRRWKTNIQPMENSLDKVQKLRGVTFEWKENGKHDIGLVAEEVGEVIPEVVAYEENGTDAKSVDYARLTVVLIEAMKEQQEQIKTLQDRITTLEKNHSSN